MSFVGESECLQLDPKDEGTTQRGKILVDKSTRSNIPEDSKP